MKYLDDVKMLKKWVETPGNDGLLSYTERVMVALASGDQSRAPGRLREEAFQEEYLAWARSVLDLRQLSILDQYLESQNILSRSGPHNLPERIANELESLSKCDMAVEEKRRLFFDVQQAAGYYMEFLI